MKSYITLFLYVSFLFVGCRYKTLNNSSPEFSGDQVINVIDPLNMSAFGEAMEIEVTPVIQFDNKYAFTDPSLLSQFETNTALGGTVGNSGNLLQVSTGATPNAYAILNSKSSMIYRDGEGVEARFTAKFTTGVASSLQYAGLVSSTDRVAFGYDGATFSILHSYGAVADIETITISTAAGTGTRSATVTLNGVSNVGSLTLISGTASTDQVAVSLATQLQSDANLSPNWQFQQVGSTVICVAKTAGQRTGSRSITFGGGSPPTGSVSQTVAGANPATPSGNIAQNAWNVTTTPFTNYDPTKLNLYRISFGYLGVADINFYVYNPNTAEFVLVHKIKWALGATTTHMQSPDLKIGIGAQSLGSTSNLTVQTASMFMGLQGKRIINETTNTVNATRTSNVTAEVQLMSLQNRIAYGTRNNRGKIFPNSISAAINGGGSMLVKVYRNITSTIDPFQYVDSTNLLALSSAAVTNTAVSGGTVLFTFIVGRTQSIQIPLSNIGIELLPGEKITVTGQPISTNPSQPISISLNWREEK